MIRRKTGSCSLGVTSSMGATDKSKDRVVINVGGRKHECYLSTIQNFPDTRLYWIAETALKMADYDPERNEFFFDRHPGCFENILNYCRTGKLHCPNDVCGPLFEEELDFWGVDELMMEPCCWANYTQHREANKNLQMFNEMHNEGNECWEDEEEEGKIKKHNQEGRMKIMKQKIWCLLEKPFSSTEAQISALISMMVILLSVATFCMETMEYFLKQKHVFEHLEYFYCVFFTLEFLIRLLCCPSKVKYMREVMTWIDIISTAQFYINFFANTNILDFLFVLRMLRIFRLFRFFKRLSGMQVIAQTLKASLNELFLLVLIVFIPMIMFSTLMYYAEKHASNTHFQNIPETFWWAVITMSTVGYGDAVPTSNYGKVIGSMCACVGVLILALPVSVIGSNFTLYYSYAQARMRLPKRRSPALVMADRALVNNKNVLDTSSTLCEGNAADRGVSPILENLASVMVDIAVPMRERRHAIQPSTINPIARKITKEKLSDKKGVNLRSALGSMVSVPLTMFSPILSNDSTSLEPSLNNNRQRKTSNLNDRKTRKKSLPVLRSEKRASDATSSLDKSIGLSHSLENFEPVNSSSDKTKRVIHVDIEQYHPRPVSAAEHKARRKLSTNSKNLSFQDTNNLMVDQTDQTKRRRKSSVRNPSMYNNPSLHNISVVTDDNSMETSHKPLLTN